MDLRILSTDERIKSGLLKALEEKPFRQITNNDVIKKAEISSRTFYRYYKDKNVLLDQMETDLVNKLEDDLNQDFIKKVDSKLEPKGKVEQVSLAIMNTVLHYAFDNREQIKTLLSANGDLTLWDEVKQTVELKFEENFKLIFGDQFVVNNYIKLQLNSYVDSKLVFIIDWLDFTDTISMHEAQKLLATSFNLTLSE